MAFVLGAALAGASSPLPQAAAGAPGGARFSLNATEIETFLARVLPAPGPNRVVSMHTLFVKADGQKSLPGLGFDSFKEAANHATYWLGQDIARHGAPQTEYFHCLSLQANAVAGQTRTGRPMVRTSRRQSNSVVLKTFFLDLDVKPSAYASKQEALAALIDLVQKGHAPAPTMVIDSGNGLHCYWTLDREIAAKDWEPLAEGFGNHLWRAGLKIAKDTFFSDSCRVLRPPATYNCKDKANPIRTRIVGRVLAHDYTVATFEPYRGTQRPHHVASVAAMPASQGGAVAALAATGHSRASARADVSALGAAPTGAPVQNDMAQGVTEAQAQPVDMAAIAERCEVLKDVLARGGEGDGEPFWRSVLYAASFAADGREWAHRFSKGDPRYTEAETDAKFDMVLAQRQRAGGKHGWPTCAEFNRHSGKCADCAFAGRVKSPMHTGRDDSDLPTGYYRQGGTIWKNILLSARKDAEPMPTCIFSYGIRDAYIEQTQDGPALNAEIHIQHQNPQRMRLTLRDINTWRERALNVFGQLGITLNKHLLGETQEFFVEYVRRLQAVAAMASKRDPFGWTKTRDGRVAFGTGAKVWRPDGGAEIGSTGDGVLEESYAAKGDFAPWRAAADMITRSGRIDLQVVLAASFAAPLVRYTGQTGLLLSAYSPKSGVQKSTAMQVAQAVWGHPVRAMNRIDDTGNSVTHKLGTLRHLPIFWDELNLDSEKDAFAKLAFVLAQGTEKSRLTADITQRQGGSWATMLVSASNFSVQEEMVRKTRNTSAALNRVFEFTVRPASPTQLISTADASIAVGSLQNHYGRAGERYAAALAREEAHLGKRISAVARMLEAVIGSVPEERFWLFTASTLLLGATMARAEGLVAFDLPALRDYLLDTLRDQRRIKRTASSDITSAEFVADVLVRYISYARSKNACLETDRLTPIGARGRQAPLDLKMPSDEARRSLRAPTVHLAHQSGAARILKHEFHAWLAEERIPARTVIDALTEHGGMAQHRVTWAAGTEWSTAQTWAYDIVLTAGPAPHNAVGNLFDWGMPATQGQALPNITAGGKIP